MLVSDDSKFITIDLLGYQLYNVPNPVMIALRNETDSMIERNFKNCIPYNERLAGAIEKEFEIVDSAKILKNYVCNVAPQYWLNFKNSIHYHNYNKKHSIRKTDLNSFSDIWVNFQKKGEFNPIHDHTGTLSFVIFVTIPYTLEDELKLQNYDKNNTKMQGTFNFVAANHGYVGADEHSRSKGINVHTLPTYKNFEGKMIVFPANLCHTVYPFYSSDDYRITIAGNIDIE